MAKPRLKPEPPVQPYRAESLEDVLERLDDHGRVYDEAFLRRVYSFSEEMHRNQRRRSGEPYMIHPLNVAHILADLKFDQTCVAVGLLHDVVEDTLTSHDAMEKSFGQDIAELVDGVTKIGRHEYVSRDQAQAETFRKLILASAKDIRVIVVKLADRLHNMQTLQHLGPEAQRRIAAETLEIYAPLAHRLGMARVKGDLEDLSFYFLHPSEYAELHDKIEEKLKLGRETTEEIRQRLARVLEEAGIDAELSHRVKRYWSIFQKLRRQRIDIAQLYDYLAFRIVTTNKKDTYAALGVVHQAWRPVPGRFKDYIAMPKPNLYQSLHTTVVGETGQPFEVQIRTREMDLIAEEGIAAHWYYKERGTAEPAGGDPNILWLRQLVEWQKEVQDPRTFLTTLKIDLYPDEVYIFTPKGEVLSFPRGATSIDFAYKVHTELGHRCVGARINGRLVPLKTPLRNGDQVEVLTGSRGAPSRDWLSFVGTSRAKSKIRHWLNTQQKEEAIELGRKVLEKEIRKRGLSPKRLLDGEEIRSYIVDNGLSSLGELLSRVGFGKLPAKQVVARLLPGEAAEPGPLRRAVSRILPSRSGPITVKGQGEMLAYLAKCCNPLPGEKIVGYITRGRGVSVHAESCSNVQNLLYHPEREIEVEWARQEDGDVFRIGLVIETEDRPGMLAKLTEATTDLKINITHIDAETETEPGKGLIRMGVQVRDQRHLDKLLRRLRSLRGVLRVRRRRNVEPSAPLREVN